MRHTKVKIMSVILSMVMLFSSFSVISSAASAPYLDDAIMGQYNIVDKVDLTKEQKSTLLLDKLDVLLADQDIYIDIPLIGALNLRSVDQALDSIYNVTGNWLYGRLTVGDLVVLETYRDDISAIRRTTAGETDYTLIQSLVKYLGNCAPTLVNIIDNSFSWGIVKGFLPPEFRVITDNVPRFLKETLWNLVNTTGEQNMPETLDGIVQYVLGNQLGNNVLPGFEVNLETATGYEMIEKAIYSATNKYIVPLLNNQLKDVIVKAVESNKNDGGELYTIINTDYAVKPYDFDTSKGIMEQLNNILGSAVNDMLVPGAFNWKMTNDGDDYLTTLEKNLTELLKTIIQKGGENEDVSGYSLKRLGDYIARVAVEQFVKHMDIDENATMEQIAYLGLRQLCASTIPEMEYPEVPETDYNTAIIEMAADLGTFYLNNNIGLECDMNTNAAQFLEKFVAWCQPYVNGLYSTENLKPDSDGWAQVDAILWSILPQDVFSYDVMFKDENGKGELSDVTLYNLVNYVLNTIFNFDLNKVDALFSHSDVSCLNQPARQIIIDVVSDILNGAFTPEGSENCVPAGINTFEDAIQAKNLKTILQNIIVALSKKGQLVETTLNLTTMLMGASNEQSLGNVDLDMNSRVYCENGTVPSGQTIRVSNRSNGVNRGWRDAAGELHQDKMYEIELVSMSNNAGLTTGEVAGTKIPANGHFDVSVSGSVAGTTEVRFDVSYYILDETGARLNTTPLVESVYSHFYTESGNYDVTSPAIGETNRVSFDSFSTYLYTTDVYDASLFSIMATNNGVLIGNAVRDVRRAVVTGTLPTGLAANNPDDGPIVSLEAASVSVDSYGTVNPYVANIDPDAEQPYGIYNVKIAFEVCSKDADSGTLTDTRDHTIVIYNDFGLPGLLNSVMNANRQRTDYLDTADAEWNAYLAAVSTGYELLQANPDHSKMFANPSKPDGSPNAYAAAVDTINAAVEALDKQVKPTDADLLATLRASVEEQSNVRRENYKLFTYDRWRKWYRNANSLVSSQDVAEGETAPAIPAFDLIYAEHMIELTYPRLIKNAVVTARLDEEIAKALELKQSDYTADSWAGFAAALAHAQEVSASTSTDLLQTDVNAARVDLMSSVRRLVKAGATSEGYLVAVDSDVVIDEENKYIKGVKPQSSDINSYVALNTNYSNYSIKCIYSGDYICTDSQVEVSDDGAHVVATYYVVISGDLNGDGMITADDVMTLEDYFYGDVELSGAFYVAADMNNDGNVNESDMSILKDLAE